MVSPDKAVAKRAIPFMRGNVASSYGDALTPTSPALTPAFFAAVTHRSRSAQWESRLRSAGR